MSNLRKELEKQKELLSSSVTKSKWAENKLKAEADQHKVCGCHFGSVPSANVEVTVLLYVTLWCSVPYKSK